MRSDATSLGSANDLVPLHRQPGFLSFLLSRLAAVFAMQIQAVVVLLLPAGDRVDRFDGTTAEPSRS